MGSMRAALPAVGMVIVLLAQVSNMEVIKAAMSKGINKYVIIVYSDALSSLFFLFCSFLFHRSLYLCLPLSSVITKCLYLLSTDARCFADQSVRNSHYPFSAVSSCFRFLGQLSASTLLLWKFQVLILCYKHEAIFFFFFTAKLCDLNLHILISPALFHFSMQMFFPDFLVCWYPVQLSYTQHSHA